MNSRYLNGYVLSSYIEMIVDCELVPYIVVCPQNSQREMSIPMDYVQNGFIVLNVSTAATGYCNVDKDNAYISLSSRFNGVSHDIFIPIECVVEVRSKCNTVALNTPSELIAVGGPKVPVARQDQPNNHVVPSDTPVYGVAGQSGHSKPDLKLVHSNPDNKPSPPKGNLVSIWSPKNKPH